MLTTERAILSPAGPALLSSASASAACAHCGLAVPPGMLDPTSADQFCCNGCKAARGVIAACGLERYYALLDDSRANRPQATSKRHTQFDDPTFEALAIRNLGGTIRELDFRLEGMHCTACVWLLERLSRVLPGVIESRTDSGRHMIRIRYDAALVKPSAIASALDTLGYTPHAAKDASSRHIRALEDRALIVRIGVAGAIAGNVMMLAFALYGGTVNAGGGMSAGHEAVFRWLSTLAGIISLAWPGSVFFKSSIGAIRARAINLDLPITIGLFAGACAGLFNTIRGSGEIYFDSITALVFLLLCGRFIQHRQQRWAADAVEMLFSVAPTVARRVTPAGSGSAESISEVPVEALEPGDTVDVPAGDCIPADGTVITGASDLDCSLLTGESRPHPITPGHTVHAGSVNLTAPIRLCVTACGSQTRAARLMELVEDASRRRPPIVRFADTVGRWFTLVVCSLSLLTFFAWLALDASRAADVAASVLLVVCPCALGLAIPLIFSVAIGRGARRGVLIKGGDVLEKLAKPGTVFLDKTCTVTQGKLAVVKTFNLTSSPLSLRLASTLEASSTHPVARCIAASFAPICGMTARDIQQSTGAGIAGTVGPSQVHVGSIRFIESAGITIDTLARHHASLIAHSGLSPVFIAVDGFVAAVLGIGDPVRPEAAATVAALRRAGWSVRLLSGDHAGLVRSVGNSIGLAESDCIGGATPEDKLAVLQAAGKDGHRTVMIGDGVNDSAALAAATVGIAVDGGAEASTIAADVRLSTAGLRPVLDLLTASRRSMNAVRAALSASIFYNIISCSLAVTGLIHPIVAAILMPLSSLTVLLIAIKWPSFDRTPLPASPEHQGAPA